MNASENSPIDPRNWLLQQAAQAGVYDSLLFEGIDPDLDIAIHRFATGTADESDEQLIVDSIQQEPPLIGYLRQQLRFEEISDVMSDVPQSQSEKLRDRFLADLPTVDESFDFSVLFELDADAEEERIWYESPPAELAEELLTLRSDEETVRELSHYQQLDHCRVKVTIGIQDSEGAAPQFSLSLDFEFVDPSKDKDLEVAARRRENGEVVETLASPVQDKSRRVSFDSLPPGVYSIEVRSNGSAFDSFSMRIQEGGE